MKNYNVIILQEWKYFVAKNIDLWIVSQWQNIDDALYNIKEATSLYLEDDFDLSQNYKQSFLTTISI